MNLSNALIGYSLLSGTNAIAGYSALSPAFESQRVRDAKALFTLPGTTPPWKVEGAESPQVSAVRALRSFIDPPTTGPDKLPGDVQTTFTTYKALDRLKVLAEAANSSTANDAVRARLNETFTKGLAELQGFLAGAASDKLDLSFARPSSRAETVPIRDQGAAMEIAGTGVVPTRDTPLPGVSGSEVLQITMSKAGGVTDTVTVDLSTTPQPPTLDSIADALNNAISAIPLMGSDGNPVLDADGNVLPRWKVVLTAEKFGDKWGFSISRLGFETISIDQVGAADALMVAADRSGRDEPTETQIFRFSDPAATLDPARLATVTALDSAGEEKAALTAPKPASDEEEPAPLTAPRATAASVTDAQGFTYLIGSTSGDVGSSVATGRERMVLSKLDSEGNTVWERALDSGGELTGASLSLSAQGGVVVTGTVNGLFDGANTDGDLLVARFGADGSEAFSTAVRAIGADEALAVSTAADGSVVVGGRSASGDAVVAKLSATGALQSRQLLDFGGSERVRGIQVEADGNVLVLTQGDGNGWVRRLDGTDFSNVLQSYDLGTQSVSSLAVGDDGTVAVGGRTIAADGFYEGRVTLLSGDLVTANSLSIDTPGSDQVDSLSFMNGKLYAGGRTSGDFGDGRLGAVDGFVARIDVAGQAVETVQQFGRPASTMEAVHVSAAAGGAGILPALGLHRGTLTPNESSRLVDQTALRAGDQFVLRVGDGAQRTITVEAGDTLQDFADRITNAARGKLTVMTPIKDGMRSLQITAKAGEDIQLIAGTTGRDALSKLGLAPTRLAAPDLPDDDGPKVRPGGAYGLDLTLSLSLDTEADAALALKRIKSAISTSQSAYRSLYWDDAKAKTADPIASGASASRWNTVAANYQAALDRLSSGSGSTIMFGV
ncbi:hypothetical protein B5C34_08935 [Pacificimonas flava]|uniref:Regulatory protein FlaEY n=2 Tax=Pacificimonas TaxID=1960290 RepID=A0A219B603_9SPHN|nr:MULTISPECIES: hypothetical protein [Pacificimonas]MBZ6379208.1 hypothetical protein [Pacificimonas aurantium]OWV33573.1 hypothetical protein B5C34_08935 [Pacificimonas flava]